VIGAVCPGYDPGGHEKRVPADVIAVAVCVIMMMSFCGTRSLRVSAALPSWCLLRLPWSRLLTQDDGVSAASEVNGALRIDHDGFHLHVSGGRRRGRI